MTQFSIDAVAMTADWQPDETLFAQIAQMMGLIDRDISEEDVGEFKAYWLGQPHRMHTQYQWHHKFILNLKNKRTAYGQKDKQVVGNQLVSKVAATKACPRAKGLVEKYGK